MTGWHFVHVISHETCHNRVNHREREEVYAWTAFLLVIYQYSVIFEISLIIHVFIKNHNIDPC